MGRAGTEPDQNALGGTNAAMGQEEPPPRPQRFAARRPPDTRDAASATPAKGHAFRSHSPAAASAICCIAGSRTRVA
jgi:hypothetical protein